MPIPMPSGFSPAARRRCCSARQPSSPNVVECLVEAGLVGARVVDEPRRHLVGDVRGQDEVAAAERDRVHVQRPGAGVHQRLHREHRGGARDAAVGTRRAGVGGDAADRALVVRELVRAGEQATGHEGLDAGGPGVDRVGAGVAPGVGLDREQLPVGGEPGAQHVAVLAGVGRGQQVLDAVLDPLERDPGHRHGHQAQGDVLGVEDGLDPEAAADVGGDDADVALGQVEQLGELGAHDVGDLGAGPERQLAVGDLVARDPGPALDGVAAVPVGGHLAVHDDRGLRERGLDVAGTEGAGEQDVVRCLVVHGVGDRVRGRPGADLRESAARTRRRRPRRRPRRGSGRRRRSRPPASPAKRTLPRASGGWSVST